MNADRRSWVWTILPALAMACASMAAFAGQTVPGGKWSWVWTDKTGSGLPMRVYTYRPRQCDSRIDDIEAVVKECQ